MDLPTAPTRIDPRVAATLDIEPADVSGRPLTRKNPRVSAWKMVYLINMWIVPLKVDAAARRNTDHHSPWYSVDPYHHHHGLLLDTYPRIV